MSTSNQGHKRKRSVDDTPIDIGLLRKAKKQIEVLRQHLADIEETEEEMGAVMLHLQGLEKILSGAKKPVGLFTYADNSSPTTLRSYRRRY